MKVIISLFILLYFILILSLLVQPNLFFDWLEDNLENSWLYFGAIAGRLLFGLLFILTANKSNHPGAIKFIGYFVLIAAVILIFMGHSRFQDLVSSVVIAFRPYAWLGAVGGLSLGGFLIYAYRGSSGKTEKI